MLLERLKEIEDSRSYHGKEYLLHHILYFTVLALLSNAKKYCAEQTRRGRVFCLLCVSTNSAGTHRSGRRQRT